MVGRSAARRAAAQRGSTGDSIDLHKPSHSYPLPFTDNRREDSRRDGIDFRQLLKQHFPDCPIISNGSARRHDATLDATRDGSRRSWASGSAPPPARRGTPTLPRVARAFRHALALAAATA